LGLPWPSRLFRSIPDAEVDDAQEGTCGRCFVGQPCLVAKPMSGSIWMGWLAPYSDQWPATVQTRGQSFLSCAVLSCHAVVDNGALQGDTQPPVLDSCGGVECLGTCIIDFYIKHMFLLGYVCLTLELLWCVCVYPWPSYHYRQ
jgi:hypothetical protein